MVDPAANTVENLWRPGPAEAGRVAILQAAAEQFVKAGFAATSIDAIADALRSTKGRVYHYYRSKAEVFLDVVAHGMHDLLEMIEPLATTENTTPTERIAAMARAHAVCMMQEANPQRVAVQMVQFRSMPEFLAHQDAVSQIIELRRKYERFIIDVLEEGMELGEFAQRDSSLMAKYLLGSLNWIPMWFSPNRSTNEDVERIAQFFTDSTLNTLTPKGN